MQDVEIPLARTAEFLRLVPARGADRAGLAVPDPAARHRADRHFARDYGERALAALPAARSAQPYVNVGFWSTVPITGARRTATSTGASRPVVTEHGGHKSLYSDAYYGEERVLGALRRCGLSRGQATLRPGVAVAGPLCEGGEAAMSLRLETPGRAAAHGDARRDLLDAVRAGRPVAVRGLRRQRGRQRRRGDRPAAGRPRARRPTWPRRPARSAWPAPTSRVTSRSRACTRATPTACCGLIDDS